MPLISSNGTTSLNFMPNDLLLNCFDAVGTSSGSGSAFGTMIKSVVNVVAGQQPSPQNTTFPQRNIEPVHPLVAKFTPQKLGPFSLVEEFSTGTSKEYQRIPALHGIGQQNPAPADKIFLFSKERNDYCMASISSQFSGEDNKREMITIDGLFIFIIKADEPDNIYVGVPAQVQERAAAAWILSTNYQKFKIDGHTSLSSGEDVLFAGELFFNNGKLEFWSNTSGHYKPPAELRHINLSPYVQELLPEVLFKDYKTEKFISDAKATTFCRKKNGYVCAHQLTNEVVPIIDTMASRI